MSDLDTLKNAALEAQGVADNLSAEVTSMEALENVDKDALKAKKAEARKAASEAKKAATAVTKAEAKAVKDAEKAAKAQAREDAKAAKAQEREEKKAQREAKEAAKAAEREANRMPEQNGIRRPKPDTKCGRVWTLADELSAKFGQPTPIADLLTAAKAEGLNEGNVKAEYARWRKFFGVTGRVSLPKTEQAA